jgi:O-antigen/teichoic acid export membrane protein
VATPGAFIALLHEDPRNHVSQLQSNAPRRLPGTLSKIAARLFGRGTTQGVIATIVIQFGGGAVSFAMFSLAARGFSAADFGHLAMWLSICQMGSVLGVLGQEMFILRSLNQYTVAARPDLAKGALVFSATIVGIVPIALGIVLGLVGTLALHESRALMAAAALFLVLGSVIALCTHIARYCVGIFLADGMRELFWRSLLVAALLTSVILHMAIRTDQFFLLSAAAIGAALVIQISAIWRALPRNILDARPHFEIRNWSMLSLRFWASTVLETINQYFDVVLIYWLLDPVAAGAYFVASRLANMFGTVLAAVHNYATRRIPALHFAGKAGDLHSTLKLMAEVVLLFVVGGLTVIAFGAEPILGLFGPSFIAQKWILIILSTGTALYAAGGPAAALLMISGHEGRYPLIVAANVVLRFIGFAILIPLFGLRGAALSTAISLAIIAVALNVLCRRWVGLDPSILILFRKSPDTISSTEPACVLAHNVKPPSRGRPI